MFSLLVLWLHRLGSAVLIIFLAYFILDVFRNRRLSMKGLMGRMILMVAILFVLIRT